MKRPLLHPEFRLNNESFSSIEGLKKRAIHLTKTGSPEEVNSGKFILEWLNEKDFIIVKTSGSTGTPKEIHLLKEQVWNSASATVSFFDLKQGTRALLCLPSEYIAGKMMLVRAMTAGWNLFTTPPDKTPLNNFSESFDFSAMVPYQVHHSLTDLHKVKKLIVGGGAVSRALEDELQGVESEVFGTYGMTETISHIAIRSLNGKNRSSIFKALSGVNFSRNKLGCLEIRAPHISESVVVTNDVVELISPTAFKLLGRIDNVINSGGIKVHPEMVEEKLADYIKRPFFIASEKDELLGERVILVLESQEKVDLKSFSEVFEFLQPYEKPKRIYWSPKFSYTETAKIQRQKVLRNLDKS